MYKNMIEKIKRFLLWLVFLCAIWTFLNCILALISFQSFLSYLQSYGMDISSPRFIYGITVFWTLVTGTIIFFVYKKLFRKKDKIV